MDGTCHMPQIYHFPTFGTRTIAWGFMALAKHSYKSREISSCKFMSVINHHWISDHAWKCCFNPTKNTHVRRPCLDVLPQIPFVSRLSWCATLLRSPWGRRPERKTIQRSLGFCNVVIFWSYWDNWTDSQKRPTDCSTKGWWMQGKCLLSEKLIPRFLKNSEAWSTEYHNDPCPFPHDLLSVGASGSSWGTSIAWSSVVPLKSDCSTPKVL